MEGFRTGSGLQGFRVRQGTAEWTAPHATVAEPAPRMVAEGLIPCLYCNPDNTLGIIG